MLGRHPSMCERCNHPWVRHSDRVCRVALNELPSCLVCREGQIAAIEAIKNTKGEQVFTEWPQPEFRTIRVRMVDGETEYNAQHTFHPETIERYTFPDVWLFEVVLRLDYQLVDVAGFLSKDREWWVESGAW